MIEQLQMITRLTAVTFNFTATCNSPICTTAHSMVAPREWKAESTLRGIEPVLSDLRASVLPFNNLPLPLAHYILVIHCLLVLL